MFGGFFCDSDSLCTLTNFSYFSVYIENGAIYDKSQSLLDILYPGHMQDTFGHFYRHNQRQCMQKIKRTRPGNGKIWPFNSLLQSTRNIQHMYMHSLESRNITHSAREWQHCSCRVKMKSKDKKINQSRSVRIQNYTLLDRITCSNDIFTDSFDY